MGRARKHRKQVSFNLDEDVAYEFSLCTNKSDVANDIFIDNIDRIGDLSRGDKRGVVRKEMLDMLVAAVRNELPEILRAMVDEYVEGEIGDDEDE